MLYEQNDLPLLTQLSEEGFVDCVFKVKQLKSDHDNHYFNLLASHQGERVGMAVRLRRRVGPGFDEEMKLIKAHVYQQGASFRSLGTISDRLITALAAEYGFPAQALRMTAEETFTVIALQQGDTEFDRHRVKLKLFARDRPVDEDAYFESFFNVDFPNGLACWNEKDHEYRAPLIRGMSAVDVGAA